MLRDRCQCTGAGPAPVYVHHRLEEVHKSHHFSGRLGSSYDKTHESLAKHTIDNKWGATPMEGGSGPPRSGGAATSPSLKQSARNS